MISNDRLPMQRQIYNFLRSATIKYDPIADYQNATLVAKGYHVDPYDMSTWKYYMNMVGQYHPSDTMMRVVSLDTRATIDFTSENLANHPRTRQAYIPGGVYYNTLCETYPEQVDLIKSILFPVTDISTAITAKNLTLLAYGSGYLEPWEEPSIVMGIRSFLSVFVQRWYLNWLDDEPYFHLCTIACIPILLACFIMAERESYVYTAHVHSFHVWSRLESEGLDNYSDVLDRNKSLFLYQNIEYFRENAGRADGLSLLVDGLLSDFQISLYGRRVVQESETYASKYQLAPQLAAFDVLGASSEVSSEIASENVQTIQTRIYEKGLTGPVTAESSLAKERTLSDTTKNNYNTKILEIRPLTLSKTYADRINAFVVETLMRCILSDRYRNGIPVFDASTGVNLFLAPRQLLALYAYAAMRAMGLTPTVIPTKGRFFHAFNETIGIPAKTLKRGDDTIYVKNYVDPALYFADLSYPDRIDTPADAATLITSLWLRYLDHLVADQSTKVDELHYVYMYLSSLCHTRSWETIDIVPGYTDYQTLFSESGISIASTILPIYDTSPNPATAWGNLADSIMSAMLPMTDLLSSFGNFTLTDFGYERLRQLFVQLCSYDLVFLESTRETADTLHRSKWNTRYYPDRVDDTVDFHEVSKMITTDNVVGSLTIQNHAGFVGEISDVVEESVGYGLTPRGTVVADTIDAPSERYHRSIQFASTSVVSGSVIVPICTAKPDRMDIIPAKTYLVDSDYVPVKDQDGSFLLDSPE